MESMKLSVCIALVGREVERLGTETCESRLPAQRKSPISHTFRGGPQKKNPPLHRRECPAQITTCVISSFVPYRCYGCANTCMPMIQGAHLDSQKRIRTARRRERRSCHTDGLGRGAPTTHDVNSLANVRGGHDSLAGNETVLFNCCRYCLKN